MSSAPPAAPSAVAAARSFVSPRTFRVAATCQGDHICLGHGFTQHGFTQHGRLICDAARCSLVMQNAQSPSTRHDALAKGHIVSK
jgi:hypothetical protein